MIEPEFPEFNKYIENLEKLKKFDFSNYSYDEIYKTYFEHALILPWLTGYIISEKFNGRRLYRVRKLSTIKDSEDKSLIQTFSYPPTFVCEQNGRANVKHKSVFYCSDAFFAGLKEAYMIEGDEAYLSIWEVNAKRDLKYVSYLPQILPDTNFWKPLGEYDHNILIEQQTKSNPNLLKYKLAIRDLITNKFINENPPYSLTSFISNENLFKEDSDLLIYPSVRTYSKYVNFAIHPNVVNEHLRLTKIFHFKIKKFEPKSTVLTIKSVGVIENDRILWRSSNEEDRIEFGAEKLNP